MEAITHFAKALGASRIGDKKTAQQELDILTSLHEQAAQSSDYWAKQIDIQRLSAKAWLEFQKGNKNEALDIMRSAADLEATTEKHPVTPGEVLPARELLADMLLEMDRYKEAQKEYETALERSPNRFNSLYGAGRAAELTGDIYAATFYYNKLVEVTSDSAERERLQHSRNFLAKS